MSDFLWATYNGIRFKDTLRNRCRSLYLAWRAYFMGLQVNTAFVQGEIRLSWFGSMEDRGRFGDVVNRMNLWQHFTREQEYIDGRPVNPHAYSEHTWPDDDLYPDRKEG